MENRTITEGLLENFARRLEAEERSRGTAEKYVRDVQMFAAWLNGRPADRQAVADWKDALLQEGRKPVTVNGKITALNAFFRFAGWPECRAKYLKLQRRLFREESRELTVQEYTRLLAAAQKGGRQRLLLLMETICATGIRVSELRYITVEAVRAGRADIALKGKLRTILLPKKLCKKLKAYAKAQKIASGEIFLTRSGKGISRKQVWAEMKALCRAAGVAATKVFPHNLRHLFARCFYQMSRDVAKLADILGHSSIDTTRIYLISTGAEHARELDRLGLVT